MKASRRAKSKRLRAKSAMARSQEAGARAAAAALGLTLRVSTITNRSATIPHWQFFRAGQCCLDYWPTAGTCWTPALGRRQVAGHKEAMELAVSRAAPTLRDGRPEPIDRRGLACERCTQETPADELVCLFGEYWLCRTCANLHRGLVQSCKPYVADQVMPLEANGGHKDGRQAKTERTGACDRASHL